MAQNFQITNINSEGRVTVLHAETNADQVLTGGTYKVPTITNIEDWTSKSTEVTRARKGSLTLLDKINSIDKALEPQSLLNSIKTVDGTNSGLDADTVDGRSVDDTKVNGDTLWTSNKINMEVLKKFNSSEVTSSPQANKVLRLNENAKLQADLHGTANAAHGWSYATAVNLTGDIDGGFVIKGGELSDISVNVQVKDNSHSHKIISHASNSVTTEGPGIAQFRKNGEIIGVVDDNGDFSGSASAVKGYSVNNLDNSGSLWTSSKILSEIGKMVNVGLDTGTVKIGGLTIQYGKTSFSGSAPVVVRFRNAFKTVMFDGHSLATADTTVVANKTASGVSNTGVTYNLNKAASGELTWFVVGV